ncbi:MAG: hypothetical protein AAFW66_00080 [Pseudomonadota bacterium]
MFAPAYFAPMSFGPRYFAPSISVVRRIVGGDDAPIGGSGKARRFIRSKVGGETFDKIEQAIKYIERAKKNPTKRRIKAARSAIDKAVPPDPYDLSTKVLTQNASKTAQELDIESLIKAQKQLDLLRQAFLAFERKEAHQEQALITILMNM